MNFLDLIAKKVLSDNEYKIVNNNFLKLAMAGAASDSCDRCHQCDNCDCDCDCLYSPCDNDW